ncbi:O-methyltransferase COMT-type, S-adenosyl-L-methionine-dependent methyltransferase [Artemisia annua]|uniref:O-methyltransferase COMT-type, S-adenosyl-L-methionine-dependent methyltransferase n=1 Tax=Artemisia annua TaxID=35608 RepID=A0A2U1KHB8_ARTAN|nr:O-methyltransferase COMT-type, S-adenosyl-L-methionine-dependent methyltransferase [Artemisia annua]
MGKDPFSGYPRKVELPIYAVAATAFSFPMVMKTAIELDLLDIIAKAGPGGSLSASQLAAQIPKGQQP